MVGGAGVKKLNGDKVFVIVNYALVTLIFLAILYPLIFVVVASISDPYLVLTGEVYLIPKGLQLDTYRNVFKNSMIWTGYLNSILYTVGGVILSLFLTITCAYAMSIPNLPGKVFILGLFVFTMYFGGGIIPSYLLIRNLHMLNTVWAIILPSAFSVYNMTIARTFYCNTIPADLYDAGRLDGCSEIRLFVNIALPLSAPIIAVITLFYAVGRWNDYWSTLMYVTDRSKFPLALVLRNILMMNERMAVSTEVVSASQAEYIAKQAYMVEGMKYSLIFISALPMLIAYPFVQKHFTKGVMIGALKG